jgi:hypothetical protein
MVDAIIEAIRGGRSAAVRPAVKANPEAARQPKYVGAAGRLRAVLDAGGGLGRRDRQGRTPIDVARLMGRHKPLAFMSAAAH